ncbi:MAG: hypothetical protein M5U28_50755 [Sandaracinaceae bacterium]|nr:hypothetical protein [Sandaracinaceae bacterium]
MLWLCALLSGCGAAASSQRAEQPAQEPAAPVPEPATATEFVRLLEAIASGARPGSLEDHVDHDFGGSASPPATISRGCSAATPRAVRLSSREGPGYGSVAIPPPMVDDSDEEARRIEAIIDELRASTEVLASCHVVERIEDEDVPQQLMLFAIAVRRGEDGRFSPWPGATSATKTTAATEAPQAGRGSPSRLVRESTTRP